MTRAALVALDTPGRYRVDPEWPGFAGHFPGDPLLPGAELADLALGLSQASSITKARFPAPVRPGDILDVTLRGTRCTVRCGATVVAEFWL